MNIETKGIFLGILSAIFWAINIILLGWNIQISSYFFAPLFFAFFHDFCSAIYLSIYVFRKKENWKQFHRVIQKKSFLGMVGAAILGGPIGMSSFLFSSKYIGSSYSSSISVLYPVVAAILSSFFLKEYLNIYKKVAIFFSIFGVSILSFTTEGITKYPQYQLGILFALLCTIGWALEGVVASYFMKEESLNSSVTIFIRQLSSSLFYFILICLFLDGTKVFPSFVHSPDLLFYILFSALLGAASYLFWYNAIDILGASIGMLLNSTYVVWTVCLEFILGKVELEMKFILAIVFISSSILLLIRDSKKEEE